MSPDEPTPDLQGPLAQLRDWSDGLPEYDLDKGATRFAAATGASGPGPEGGGAKSSRHLWIIGALGVGVVAVLLARGAGGGGASATAPPHVEDEPRVVASPRAVVAVASATTDAPAAPSTDRAPPGKRAAIEDPPAPLPTESRTAPGAPADRHARKRPNKAARATESDAPPPPQGPSEVELVRRMRSAVHTDPVAALRIGKQLASEFPDGVLAEERRALTVFALAASGATDKAKRKGARFLQDYPGSMLATRVRSIVDEGEEPADQAQ